ncbi:peptide deformylase [Mesobacterium pallidum]|uniref:peptide deformylase n=1 Tax=Mesobacterium pallidum TaxID=2872037 RepID=UPI001EE241F9|nr:peptide deformylase [Mesobacterium pallidum]
MAVLPILRWPDPRLSQVCEPAPVAEALLDLIDDMFDTMYAAQGRGLAAPQVGVMQRFFVMDAGWKEGDSTPEVMIDPAVIAWEKRDVVMEEACLSIPGVVVPVARPVAVTLGWRDRNDDYHMRDFDGAEARIIQHELDHLDGRVHFTRIDDATRGVLETPYLEALS